MPSPLVFFSENFFVSLALYRNMWEKDLLFVFRVYGEVIPKKEKFPEENYCLYNVMTYTYYNDKMLLIRWHYKATSLSESETKGIYLLNELNNALGF